MSLIRKLYEKESISTNGELIYEVITSEDNLSIGIAVALRILVITHPSWSKEDHYEIEQR